METGNVGTNILVQLVSIAPLLLPDCDEYSCFVWGLVALMDENILCRDSRCRYGMDFVIRMDVPQ